MGVENYLLRRKERELLQVMANLPNSCDCEKIMNSLYKCEAVEITLLKKPLVDVDSLIKELKMSQFAANYVVVGKNSTSTKLGNIKINIKKLINSLPEPVTAVVGIVEDITILKICALLQLWKFLREIVTVEIDEIHAIIILALWRNRNRENKITSEHGFECSKILYFQYFNEDLTLEKYREIIKNFEDLGSIEWIGGDIWLKEKVTKVYID